MKKKSHSASFGRVVLTAIVLVICQAFAVAGTETILHQFVSVSQGAFPGVNLVEDAQGNLYGVTSNGGSYGFGVVFRLTRNSSGQWEQTVLHNFTALTDGYQPNSLAIDAQGNLFGTTLFGGSDSYTAYGYGVVYELSPNAHGTWNLTVLHTFSSEAADGTNPAGTLLDSAGNIYGTASGGIDNNSACSGYCGIVYRLSPSNGKWIESILYKFQGNADGGVPAASLAMDSSGNLYGATTAEYLAPGVFKLTPGSSHWTETTLFNVTNAQTQGGRPNGITLDAAGNIYGTASEGGVDNDGVVFELVRGSNGLYTQSILHVFTGGSDGNYPEGNITIDSAGNLYGTTYWGGAGSTACVSCGTVYKLSPSGGGWTDTILHRFVGGTDGANPQGSVLIDPSGNLIGTTRLGTEANFGSVFELAAGSYTETQIYGFPSTDGANIGGGLVEDAAGNFYGVAESGGLNQCSLNGDGGCGLIFKLSRQANGTWGRTVLHNFTGTQNGDGATPVGTLIFDKSGNLYGTTVYGGGTVFTLTPTASGGWSFRTIYEFGRHKLNDGSSPQATLVFDAAGNLYGTTISGGNGSYLNCSQCGTVYKLAPSVNGQWTESVIYNFQGLSDGSFPTAGLAIDAAGDLYGTTSEGGIGGGFNGSGVVFKLSPNSNGTWTQSTLYEFTGGIDGAGPIGGVILDSAGNLYGTTPTGGQNGPGCSYGCGVVYKLTPGSSGPWTESVIYSFAGIPDGTIPQSTLTFDAAGNLYGTTGEGGTASNVFCFSGGCGTVFKLTPSAGSWTESILYSFNGPAADGADPFAGVILDSAGKIYGTTSAGGINGYTYQYGGTVFEITP